MRNNIRKLLASLSEILWEEFNWEPISVTELFDDSSVKKAFRKAMLVVHPGILFI